VVKFSHTYTRGAPLKATKTLGAGIIALATPLFVLAATMPAAQANPSDVDASIDLTNTCAWKFGSVPAEITLTSSTGEYIGDALVITNSTTFNIAVGVGSSIDGSIAIDLGGLDSTTDCSFFNDVKAAVVSATLTDSSTFAASNASGVLEPNMNFTLNSTYPLSISADPSTNCNQTYFTNGTDNLDTSGFQSVDTVGQAVEAIKSRAIPSFIGERIPDYSLETTYKIQCIPDMTLKTTIPADKIPLVPGTTYSFAGPGILFSMANPAQ
jgi:hypothetical protein